MYQKIRITVASVVVIALCVLSSTITLSYFTDTKSSANEFTVGNASTALAIYSNADGTEPFDASNYTLVPNMPDIPFYLEATNNGNIPVYQRFRIVIPSDLANHITLATPETDEYTVEKKSNVYYITLNNALGVDEATGHWPTTAIRIGNIPTDMSPYTCSDNTNNHCVLGLNVYSDVIQTAGFENAAEAFESLDNNH